jgi:hypothetical protein
MLQNRNQTIFLIFSLPVVVVMGFLFKYYTGPGQVWSNNYGTPIIFSEVRQQLSEFL